MIPHSHFSHTLLSFLVLCSFFLCVCIHFFTLYADEPVSSRRNSQNSEPPAKAQPENKSERRSEAEPAEAESEENIQVIERVEHLSTDHPEPLSDVEPEMKSERFVCLFVFQWRGLTWFAVKFVPMLLFCVMLASASPTSSITIT